MMHALLVYWFNLVRDWGYWGVIALMAMESSIFPVPSEVVVPPAAYFASQGHMTFWGVVAAGTFGSWLGSAITYLVSRWLGRLVIVRFGKYFFINEAKLARAEHFIQRYETGGVFFARLLPVLRHLISIPAGIVRMNFWVFSAVTTVGAFIWCTVLAWFGDKIGREHPDLISNPEAMVKAVKHESIPIIGAIALMCVLYVVTMRLTRPREAKATGQA